MTKVLFSLTAAGSAQELKRLLAIDLGNEKATQAISDLVCVASERIGADPASCMTCTQAMSVGLLKYRELNVAKFRVIYALDHNNDQAVIHLFLRRNQSLMDALINHCLIYA